MKNSTFLIILFYLCLAKLTVAHPGMGLVMDSNGNLYYTDLKHIWKQTPNGQKSIAVENVHSHELYMDQNDNLFGEHLWYEASSEIFFHYHWCLKKSGQLIYLTDTLNAFAPPRTFSFARDKLGNMYWYEKHEKSDTFHFVKKDTLGNKSELAEGIFKDIRWVFSTPEGEVYFLDLDNLYKINADKSFQTIAKKLCFGTLWTALTDKRHSVFGVWFDKQGNTYAAVSEDNCIKKIGPDGKTSIIYKSKLGSPINGLFDKEGHLWVLEGIGIFESRVVKVEQEQVNELKLVVQNNLRYIFVVLGLVAVIMLIKRLWQKRKSKNKIYTILFFGFPLNVFAQSSISDCSNITFSSDTFYISPNQNTLSGKIYYNDPINIDYPSQCLILSDTSLISAQSSITDGCIVYTGLATGPLTSDDTVYFEHPIRFKTTNFSNNTAIHGHLQLLKIHFSDTLANCFFPVVIILENFTKIEEISTDRIALYPNPTNGIVNIELNTTGASLISISNFHGKTMLKMELETHEKVIDLSMFPAGLYILEANKGQQKLRKIIIKI